MVSRHLDFFCRQIFTLKFFNFLLNFINGQRCFFNVYISADGEKRLVAVCMDGRVNAVGKTFLFADILHQP